MGELVSGTALDPKTAPAFPMAAKTALGDVQLRKNVRHATDVIQAKRARGWEQLKVYSDSSGDYTRDYVSKDDADVPAYNVFTRRDGAIRHFWGSELLYAPTDPHQDPRHVGTLEPVWNLLDLTREGRPIHWDEQLHY